MRRLAFLLFALILGCNWSERFQDPCKRDSFFCNDPETWRDRLPSMSTRRIFELYVLDRRMYMPIHSDFENALGERGEEAIALLQAHLESNPRDRDVLFYRPIIDAVTERGYNFCHSDHYSRMLAILSETRERVHPAASSPESLRALCSPAAAT